MPDVNAASGERFTIICLRCARPVTTRTAWVGREVQCPHCASVLRVPPAPADGRPVRALAPSMTANRYFNFGCGRCKSLLEGHTGMCGQRGRCPTCGANFIVPHVDPSTGLPVGEAYVAADGENPTPLHAYAASGQQAPQIVRTPDGESRIVCPRCGLHNQIDANSCASCGLPFTIEAAPKVRSLSVGGREIAAILFGLISLASYNQPVLVVPGIIAMLLGWRAMRDRVGLARPVAAIVGLGLGMISLLLFVLGRLL